jgi:hypothetical protein
MRPAAAMAPRGHARGPGRGRRQRAGGAGRPRGRIRTGPRCTPREPAARSGAALASTRPRAPRRAARARPSCRCGRGRARAGGGAGAGAVRAGRAGRRARRRSHRSTPRHAPSAAACWRVGAIRCWRVGAPAARRRPPSARAGTSSRCLLAARGRAACEAGRGAGPRPRGAAARGVGGHRAAGAAAAPRRTRRRARARRPPRCPRRPSRSATTAARCALPAPALLPGCSARSAGGAAADCARAGRVAQDDGAAAARRGGARRGRRGRGRAHLCLPASGRVAALARGGARPRSPPPSRGRAHRECRVRVLLGAGRAQRAAELLGGAGRVRRGGRRGRVFGRRVSSGARRRGTCGAQPRSAPRRPPPPALSPARGVRVKQFRVKFTP